jgi:23S rRNA-/tRNA-specific pseudouridylate synthase
VLYPRPDTRSGGSGSGSDGGYGVVAIDKPAGIATQGGTGIEKTESIDYWLRKIAAIADPTVGSGGRAQASQGPEVLTSGIEQAWGSGSEELDDDLAIAIGAGAGDDSDALPLRLVHRLDRGVSGALLLARSRAVAESLVKAFSERRIKKTYVALVGDALPAKHGATGKITAPIPAPSSAAGTSKAGSKAGSKGQASHKYAASSSVLASAGARTGPGTGLLSAETLFQATVFPRPAGADPAQCPYAALTLLTLNPITGRKHQLRRHVAEVLWMGKGGILGDDKYGQRRDIAGAKQQRVPRYKRVLLHCHSVFIPTSTLGSHQKSAVNVTAPLPAVMRRLLVAYGCKDKALLTE